jgi:hypothetical protein
MHLLLIACEYAGKKTLAVGISRWMIAAMGVPFVRWHDDYIVPRLNGHPVIDGEGETPVPGKRSRADRRRMAGHDSRPNVVANV